MARFGSWLDELEWTAVGQPSASARRLVKSVIGPMVKAAFRPSMQGVENMPTDGPFMVVANHSAGVDVVQSAVLGAFHDYQAMADVVLNSQEEMAQLMRLLLEKTGLWEELRGREKV